MASSRTVAAMFALILALSAAQGARPDRGSTDRRGQEHLAKQGPPAFPAALATGPGKLPFVQLQHASSARARAAGSIRPSHPSAPSHPPHP